MRNTGDASLITKKTGLVFREENRRHSQQQQELAFREEYRRRSAFREEYRRGNNKNKDKKKRLVFREEYCDGICLGQMAKATDSSLTAPAVGLQ